MGTLGKPISSQQTPLDAAYESYAGKIGKPVKMESSVGDLSMNFLSGFNKAVYMATGAQGYEEIVKLTGFDEWQKEHGDVGGFTKEFLGLSYEPQNASERTAQRAGEDAVLGVIMAAGSLLTAGATQAVPLAAPLSERVAGAMVGASRNSPFMASLAETLGWSAYGGASHATAEAGYGPTAQMAVGLAAAGGLPMIAKESAAMLATPAKYVGKKVLDIVPSVTGMRWLWKTFGRPAQEAKATTAVDKALASANEKQTKEVYDLFDALGVKRPTVAEASGSPQLLAAQHAIEQNASGTTLDFLVGRKTAIAQGVIAATRKTGPTASLPEETIIVSVRSELNRIRSTTSKAAASVGRQLSAAEASVPSSNRVELGSTLRERRATLRESVRDGFNERADNIGLNDSKALFDITPFKSAVDKKWFGPQRPLSSKDRPQTLKDVNSLRLDPKTKRVFDDWGGIQEYRQRLNDDISAAKIAGRMSEYRQLVAAKEMLDGFVAKSEPARVNPKDWQSFRTDYGEQFINRFEKGTASKVSRPGRRDTYVTKDEAVADAFLRSESTVDDFYRLYGSDPEAMLAMRSAILDRANQAAVVDGVVNPAKLSTYLHTNQRVLSKFPDIQASLTSTRDGVRTLSRRAAVLNKRAAHIESTNLAAEVEILGREGFDSMLDAAIKDPSKMRTLFRSVERLGYDRAPLASVIWQRAMSKIPEVQPGQLPPMAQFKKFIEVNEKSLRIALGRRHLTDLKNIYVGVEVVGRTPVPAGQPLSSGALEALEKTAGTGLSQLSSRIFAVQSGRLGHKWMAVDLGSRLANKWGHRKANALMYEALFNSRMASDLAMFGRTKNPNAKLKKRIDGYLFNMGLGDGINLEDEK